MEQQKTHWKKLTHPDYLGAYELLDGSEKGKELTVTIDRVVRQQVVGADGKKEECTVCYLKGVKPMILNATNQKIMTKVFGSPYVEDWGGKKMTLYVAKVKAFGDTVDALRVRDKAPVLPDMNPSHPKWEGAKQALQTGQTTLEDIKQHFTITPANEALILAK